jgi:hypothetical protein
MRPEVEEVRVMATKDLLKEALGALKAVQRLNLSAEADDDVQMHRALKRVDRILDKTNKAA